MNKARKEQLLSQGVSIVETSAKKRCGTWLYYLAGTLLALLFLFPLLYMFAASTKSEEEIAHQAGSLMMFIPDFSSTSAFAENYHFVLFSDSGLLHYAFNTLVYALIVIVLNLLVNGLAGYVLAKMNFPGKRFFLFIVLFLIVVPVETSIIPLYAVVKMMLGLKQNLSILGVILPASINVFNIFLFTQFFSGIPKMYLEAAKIDGASSLRIFFSIILPMSKPIVATVAVFSFIGTWNDYLWPMMVLSDPSQYPIQAALTSIQAISGITTGQVMAALVLTSLPIFVVYILAQKYIVQGFGKAGLKI